MNQWDIFVVQRNVWKMVLAAIGTLWVFCNICINMNNAKTTHISLTVTAFHISDPQANSKWGDFLNVYCILMGFLCDILHKIWVRELPKHVCVTFPGDNYVESSS